MSEAPGVPWIDRAWLIGNQYKTDANLAARQSIYVHQQPRHDITRLVIDLGYAADPGVADSPRAAGGPGVIGSTELVADVGCGNGAYLAELSRRGHAGPVLGLDLSPGMLSAARDRDSGAALALADATALPLRDGGAGLTLAPHMLYHVPEPPAAVRELRRITRPGGRVLVVLNGDDHLRELRDALNSSLPGAGASLAIHQERLTLDAGERLLAEHFGSVIRHDFTAGLVVPAPQPIADYVRSSNIAQLVPDPISFMDTVLGHLGTGPDGNFHITTHSGCLVCS
jgi:SAM-dependent methyltransferase